MGIVNSAEFTFELKGEDLYFHTKGFNEVTEKVKVEGSKKTDITIKLNKAFIDAVENLTDDVTIELKSNYPITVTSKTENLIIRILVAPIVQEGEK